MPKIIEVQTRCPICHGEVARTCKCPRTDSVCENGHEWHTCTVHNVYVEGHSDHSTDTSSCTCGQDPVDYKDKARRMCLEDLNSSYVTVPAVEKLARILEKADQADAHDPQQFLKDFLAFVEMFEDHGQDIKEDRKNHKLLPTLMERLIERFCEQDEVAT